MAANDIDIDDTLGTSLILSWSSKEPQAAYTWINDDVTGDKRNRHLSYLVGVARPGCAVAQQAVFEIEPGHHRAFALSCFVNSIMNNEGQEGGEHLLARLSDPQKNPK